MGRPAVGDGVEMHGSGASRRRHDIVKEVFTALLADQVGRAESLNGVNAVIAGLGGVVTTLAGLVASLALHDLGLAGVAGAGSSVIFAVIGLMVRRPGREPIDLDGLVYRMLHTDDVALTEDVLLYADLEAIKQNDRRLRLKARWTMAAAVTLAAAVGTIVAAIVCYGS
jgi:hypothetical protein